MLVTAYIPPKHKQYIGKYGLFSSHNRGKREEHKLLCRLAPDGWKEKHEVKTTETAKETDFENSVETKKQRSTWARLIKKVYGIDPLICPKCRSKIRIIAFILDPGETEKILQHLGETDKLPPNSNQTG